MIKNVKFKVNPANDATTTTYNELFAIEDDENGSSVGPTLAVNNGAVRPRVADEALADGDSVSVAVVCCRAAAAAAPLANQHLVFLSYGGRRANDE